MRNKGTETLTIYELTPGNATFDVVVGQENSITLPVITLAPGASVNMGKGGVYYTAPKANERDPLSFLQRLQNTLETACDIRNDSMYWIASIQEWESTWLLPGYFFIDYR